MRGKLRIESQNYNYTYTDNSKCDYEISKSRNLGIQKSRNLAISRSPPDDRQRPEFLSGGESGRNGLWGYATVLTNAMIDAESSHTTSRKPTHRPSI